MDSKAGHCINIIAHRANLSQPRMATERSENAALSYSSASKLVPNKNSEFVNFESRESAIVSQVMFFVSR